MEELPLPVLMIAPQQALALWLRSLKKKFPDWTVTATDEIDDEAASTFTFVFSQDYAAPTGHTTVNLKPFCEALGVEAASTSVRIEWGAKTVSVSIREVPLPEFGVG